MKRTRLAIIGAGHLGRIHTKLACSLPDFEVVAVVDPIAANREAMTKEFGLRAVASHPEIKNEFDAAVVATPTKYHFEVAFDLLEQGVHIFVEKPITPTATDAELLIQAAAAKSCVLQVGHVERFNPAFLAAQDKLSSPRYLSAVRNGTYTFRSTDVSVVLDLMIHDLDLALSIIPAEPRSVTASGGKVFGPNEDWAEARVTFANGTVACFSASRVHPTAQRTLQAIGEHGACYLDFQTKTALFMERGEELRSGAMNPEQLSVAQREAGKARLSTDLLIPKTLPVTDNNAILAELREFAAGIRGEVEVRVNGVAGANAVALAERILAEIATNRFSVERTTRRDMPIRKAA